MVGTEIAGHILREHLGTGLLGESYRAESSDGSSILLRIARKPDYVYLLKSGYRSRVNIDGTSCRGFNSAEVKGDQAVVLADFLDLQPLSTPLAENKLPGAGSIGYLMTEVAGIVNTAHERGLVHGGLKPQNILLGDGRIVVTDFGFAELVRKLDRDGFLQQMQPPETGPGPLSPCSYLPPEQLDGSTIATPEGDVYALGVLLLALLTGDTRIDEERIQGSLPKSLAQLISRSVADQAERIPDAQELLAALESLDLEALAEELDASSQEVGGANTPPTPAPVEAKPSDAASTSDEDRTDESAEAAPKKSADERAGETHIESNFDIPPLVKTSAPAVEDDEADVEPAEATPKKSAHVRAGETHIESAFDLPPLSSTGQEGAPIAGAATPVDEPPAAAPPAPLPTAPPAESGKSQPDDLPDLPPLDDFDPFENLENLAGAQPPVPLPPVALDPAEAEGSRPLQRRTDELPAWKPEPAGDDITPFRDAPSSDSGEALQPLEHLDTPMSPPAQPPAAAATPVDPFGELPDLPSLEDVPPFDPTGLPPLEGLPPLDPASLPPLDPLGLPPLEPAGLPPLDPAGLSPLEPVGLPPLDAPGSSPFDLPGLPPLPPSAPQPPGPINAASPGTTADDPFAPFLPTAAPPPQEPAALPSPPPPLGLPGGFPAQLNVSEERDGFFGEGGNDPFGRSDPELEVVSPQALPAPLHEKDPEPLDPAEATRMVEQETVRRRSGTLPAVPLDDTLDSNEPPAPVSGSSVPPHLRKTQPAARPPAIGSGSGSCGLVISGLLGDKKRQAASIIAELRNISQSDALKVCSSQIVPVLKRVSREEAERAQSLFKQANINSKITQRHR